ncbi:DUF1365 domain-containing protein [Kangiella marina]|uniref:DUF1365 domain-containing protein n=2 Tax=Kangiella marina TaxID=1079178 RepID=A0ABP8IIC0_9GAMM
MDWTLLDLDEVEQQFKCSKLWSVGKKNIVSYRAGDFHIGSDNQPVESDNPSLNKLRLIETIKKRTGENFDGKIYMLSHLRNYGYNFNSVCFYYCFDQNEQLVFLVSEITNTPWGERHSYVFNCDADNQVSKQGVYQFSFNKEFHVSPFIQMDMLYRWTFTVRKEHLRVHMSVLTTEGKKYFDATFTGTLLPLTKRSMRKFAFSHAFQPHKMSLLIYWQALKLWLKRLKVFDHPKHSNS